jgi:hypothetical protein
MATKGVRSPAAKGRASAYLGGFGTTALGGEAAGAAAAKAAKAAKAAGAGGMPVRKPPRSASHRAAARVTVSTVASVGGMEEMQVMGNVQFMRER